MATTREQNERLTQVGPGTPMGDLLRRYWQPIARRGRARAGAGAAGALLRRRPHAVSLGSRRVRARHRSLSRIAACRSNSAFPTRRVCAARITAGSSTGTATCVEQPFEDRTFPDVALQRRASRSRPIRCKSWAACSSPTSGRSRHRCCRAGICSCATTSTQRSRSIRCRATGCSAWTTPPTRCTSSICTPPSATTRSRSSASRPAMTQARHLKIEFDVFRYGIMKRRLLEGAAEDSDEWTIGHPLIFPNLLAVGNEGSASFQYRIPVDDTHTIQFAYRTTKRQAGRAPSCRSR